MSEDQQKQPESINDQPQTPPTPPAAGQSRTRLGQTSKTAIPTRTQKQPFLKAQGIKVLRGTIGLLEGIVEKLEEEPVNELPTAAPPSTPSVSAPVLDTTTGIWSKPVDDREDKVDKVDNKDKVDKVDNKDKVDKVDNKDKEESSSQPTTYDHTPTTAAPEPVTSAEEPTLAASASDTPTVAPKPVVERPADKQGLEPAKQGLEPAKPKLTDRILPSFGRLQAFWNGTLAKVRSLLPQAWNEKLSDWALTGAIAGIVVVVLVTTAALLPETPAQEAKAPPNTIEAPPELKAPDEPQPVEPEPLPTPELTPEQGLIAAIQKQVAEITDQYGSGLIRSIEANFLGSRLIVKVSDGWYNLDESQQNKLADEMLRRSKELDFSKLEITDIKGTLLARSPVVGPNMVILKRQELAANL